MEANLETNVSELLCIHSWTVTDDCCKEINGWSVKSWWTCRRIRSGAVAVKYSNCKTLFLLSVVYDLDDGQIPSSDTLTDAAHDSPSVQNATSPSSLAPDLIPAPAASEISFSRDAVPVELSSQQGIIFDELGGKIWHDYVDFSWCNLINLIWLIRLRLTCVMFPKAVKNSNCLEHMS